MEKIIIGSDHGGFHLKQTLKEHLEALGYEIQDIGTLTDTAIDYPDIADKMAEAIGDDKQIKGILICGTGIGISIAANRHKNVRAALVHDGFTTKLSREHNDANVLVLGGRVLGVELAIDCVDIFLKTDFIKKDSYIRRVNKLEGL